MRKFFLCFTLLNLILFSCETGYTDYYQVSIYSSLVGGSIKVVDNRFRVGHMVDIIILPDSGYQFVADSLCYYTSTGTRYGINGTRFHMPDSNITLFCQFKESSGTTNIEVRNSGNTLIENGGNVYFVGKMSLNTTVMQGGMVITHNILEWESDPPNVINVNHDTGTLTASVGESDVKKAKITAKIEGKTVFSFWAYAYPLDYISDAIGDDFGVEGTIRKLNLGKINTDYIRKFHLPEVVRDIPVTAVADNALGDTTTSPDDKRAMVEELFLPATLKKIGKSAFFKLENLKVIHCYAETPPEMFTDTFAGCSHSLVIRVPDDQIESYKIASTDATGPTWGRFAGRITGLNTYSICWGTIRGSDKNGVVLDESTGEPVIANAGTITLSVQNANIDASMSDEEGSNHPNRQHPVMGSAVAGERVYISFFPEQSQQYAPTEGDDYKFYYEYERTDEDNNVQTFKEYADHIHNYTSFIMPKSDIYVYCTFKWATTEITLNFNGGMVYNDNTSATVSYGDTISFTGRENERPVRVGYIFEGYYRHGSGGSKTSFVNQNMRATNKWLHNDKIAVLHAEWTPLVHTLQLNPIGATDGSDIYMVQATFGEYVPIIRDSDGIRIEPPTKDDSEFVGYTTEDGTMYYNKNLDPIRKWDRGGEINEKKDEFGNITGLDLTLPDSSFVLVPKWTRKE